jgi:hypothetical protein
MPFLNLIANELWSTSGDSTQELVESLEGHGYVVAHVGHST